MKFKDSRLKLVSDVLGGMKVLKLYAWEESMQGQIFELRRKEVKNLQKVFLLDAAITASFQLAPLVVGYFQLKNKDLIVRPLWSAFSALPSSKAIRCALTWLSSPSSSSACSDFPSTKFPNC